MENHKNSCFPLKTEENVPIFVHLRGFATVPSSAGGAKARRVSEQNDQTKSNKTVGFEVFTVSGHIVRLFLTFFSC